MSRKLLVLVLVSVVALAASSSHAVTLQLVNQPTIVQVPLTYKSQFDGYADPIKNEIVVKSFDDLHNGSLQPIVLNVAGQTKYDASTNILHLTERVYNNTSNTWTGFTVAFSGAQFSTGDTALSWTPSVISINNGGAVIGYDPDDNLYNQIKQLNELTPSSGTTLAINQTLAPGSFIDLYLPIQVTGANGTFSITQTPVPEPTTIAALAGLGLVGLIAVWRRRK
jgi:hypothetical protein